MKFSYVIGNPPYQDNNSNKKLYPNFYIESQTITNNSLSYFQQLGKNLKIYKD